nr:reverse transcriptase [Tanacetum cinerariifolium]
MQYSRVTKIEFPKFGGEDVRGWLLECERFFKLMVLQSVKSEEQSLSFFLAGLQIDVEVIVRMFKLRSLAELYGLAKLLEANLNAMKSNNTMPLLPNLVFSVYNSTYPNSPKPVFQLDVFFGSFTGNDDEEIVWEAANKDVDCELFDVLNVVQDEDGAPHIYLNALTVLNMVYATLTNDAPKGLQTLLADYNDVFAIPKKLPPIRSHDHRILMKEGSPTVNIRPYRHHVTQKDAIKSMVQELLDAGVIRYCQSHFFSPIVMVKKKDDSWRMCVDYRQLNKHTIKDKFPIPLIEELTDELCS